MICVWEQNRRPLHVSVDTGSNPRPDQRRHMVATNWALLRPTLFSLFCFFYPQILPLLSPLLASFPQIPPLPLSPIPVFIMSHFRSLFLFQTDPSPSLSPNPSRSFPYPYHTFTTCQEDSGLCGFCPALGEVQLRLRWAGCRFGLRSRPGPTVRKWPLLWFKLTMRQRNRAFFFCWREEQEKWGERVRSHLQATWKRAVIDSKPSLIKYFVHCPKNILPEVVLLLSHAPSKLSQICMVRSKTFCFCQLILQSIIYWTSRFLSQAL